MKKLLTITILILTSAVSYATEVSSLTCKFGSRDFKIKDDKKILVSDVATHGNLFQVAELGGYKVKLGTAGNGTQGQLIVGHTSVGVVQKISWQSLRQFKGMNIPMEHGFTGLMYFGGESEWGDKSDKLPELQVRCWVD